MGATLFAEAGERALARLGAGPTSKSAEDLRLVRPGENYSLVETAIREAIFQ